MARIARDDLVVVRTPFFVGNTLVRGGEVWTADDRVVRSHRSAFAPLEVRVSDPEPEPRQRPVFRRPAPPKRQPPKRQPPQRKATATP